MSASSAIAVKRRESAESGVSEPSGGDAGSWGRGWAAELDSRRLARGDGCGCRCGRRQWWMRGSKSLNGMGCGAGAGRERIPRLTVIYRYLPHQHPTITTITPHQHPLHHHQHHHLSPKMARTFSPDAHLNAFGHWIVSNGGFIRDSLTFTAPGNPHNPSSPIIKLTRPPQTLNSALRSAPPPKSRQTPGS